MFIKIAQEAAKIFKKNLNLAQLVFIFFIIITLFSPTIAGVKINIKIIPIIILWFCVLCAFFAGLFFAFKKAIDYETTPPENPNPYNLSPLYFAEFFQGVGYYTKKFLLAGLIYLILLVLIAFGYNYIVSHYVVIPESFSKLISSEILLNDAKLIEFLNSLSTSDIAKIGKLSLLTFGISSIFGYITMLYPVVLVNKEDNPLVCFGISIKYLFKNIPASICLFMFFNIILTFATIIGMNSANNIFLSIVSILLQCYFNVWYLISLFVYYEKHK